MNKTTASTTFQLQTWISAARLRTLPLAFAVIALGAGVANFHVPGSFDLSVFLLAVLTSFSYQILSNYANDLGDGMRGTDDQRQGEQRAVASGAISIASMKNAVLLFTLLALVFGSTLIFLAFTNAVVIAVFMVLHVLAIWSARSYTLGSNPYAYWGGGDLFVFLFFGYTGVLGSSALFTTTFFAIDLLPATVAGAMSAAVLTLNNLRDRDGDLANGKQTLVVRFGHGWGRGYFKVLIALSQIFALIFSFYVAFKTSETFAIWGYLIFLIALRFILRRFSKATNAEKLDGLLKPTALVTLLYCLITAISINL